MLNLLYAHKTIEKLGQITILR